MKKSKAKLIKRILDEHGVPESKAGFRAAKAAYNRLSHKSKGKVA